MYVRLFLFPSLSMYSLTINVYTQLWYLHRTSLPHTRNFGLLLTRNPTLFLLIFTAQPWYCSLPISRGHFFKIIHERYPYFALTGEMWVSFVVKNHPIARPLVPGMGVFFDPASDWYSASVPAIINAVSYYIRLCYNGTRVYCLRKSSSTTRKSFRLLLL